MPQLAANLWFPTLLCLWAIFMVILIPKAASHTSPALPHHQSPQPISAPPSLWNWP